VLGRAYTGRGLDELDADHFRTLFDYNYWARDRVFAAMHDLSEADYSKKNGFTYGSIRGILTHCLDAEYGWRCRFQGEARRAVISEMDLATPALLEARWNEEEATMRAYLARLKDEDLVRDVVWRARDGSERRLPNLWLSLAHVLNHSTQHRSEAAEALTMIGRSPGDLDLGLYASEIGRS
jgi:uncharacterized damage-inducible protein DinB